MTPSETAAHETPVLSPPPQRIEMHVDGEVRFKASVDFGATPPTPELIRPLLAAATMTSPRSLPGLQAV